MRAALFPKEHGAYGQMSFPMVTALAVFGFTVASLMTAIAIVTGFLAHEPALVLLGLRGPRARRELSRAAALWLAMLGAATALTGIAAVWLAPPYVFGWFALPLAPAALLVAAIAARQEKSWHAELAVAITFSLAAVPLSLASGASLRAAFSVAIPFLVIFVAGTLAVRTVILRVRGGGNAKATAATRAAVLAFALASAIVLAIGGRVTIVPWAVFLAALPGLVLSVAVAVSSIPATRLKTIGWSLVGASTLASLIVITSL